ncbi:AI-2E family transporter, partial [Candidatus Beckwithbacteria bacterium]|nr:AI-2E family transporter [Candidatus Beckwithbacteria bacterium]
MEKIEISYKTIIFTVLFLLSLWVLFQIRWVILYFFVSFVLMTALNPVVNFFHKIKFPRILGIIITFLLLLSILSLIIASIAPPLVEQTINLVNLIGSLVPKDLLIFNFDLNSISSIFQTFSNGVFSVFKIIIGVGSNLITFFTIFVLTFYLLLERINLTKYLHMLFDNKEKEERVEHILLSIESRLGGWIRGEITLMFIVGLLTYVGLIILRIPYALPLAILAGLLELIPNLGPTLSAIPTVIVAFTISPLLGLAGLALGILVQQLENNLIVP